MAIGGFGPADGRAQVHHCLGMIARPVRGRHCVGEFPDFIAAFSELAFEAMNAGDHPRDICIDDDGALPEGDRGYSGGGVGAESR